MLDPERERKVEELFQLAVDLSRSERDGFLRRHCVGDDELRSELESLLRQDDEGTKEFLRSPVVPDSVGALLDGTATGNGTSSNLLRRSKATGSLPERIGRYRLVRKIGEGGMGAVYLAEQELPVRREVALKIVKLGMDTEKVVARFEHERQTLALMDHPGIAQIYDGGATEQGRPYFVMEYVQGLPIHDFCDKEGLDVRARLRLFIEVCEAVQHAHQRGVIHRDIKPSNVLVTRRDGRPVPKVIDFGIARLTSSQSDTRASDTRGTTIENEVIGTCYYMSPEQADRAANVVDTRSDIYSLGVVLYELLAGVLPFDSDALRDKALAEVQRILRDTDPPPPSARLTRLERSHTTALAGHRGTDPRTLIRRLEGDLDWITIKAMAKEPARRYATASELATDVRRFLEDKSVFASPPDLTYQLTKFVRRHRVAVLSGALVLVALVAGIIGTTGAMLEADNQREEAEASAGRAIEAEAHAADEARRADRQRIEAEQAREVAERATLRAEEEARRARAVEGFLLETISLADPEVALSSDVLRSMLAHAGETVPDTFASEPEKAAVLHRVLGQAYHSLDDLEAAEHHLQRALQIHEALPEVPLEEVYTTMRRLSKVNRDSDSRKAYDLSQQACFIAVDLVHQAHTDLGEGLIDVVRKALHGKLADALDDFEAFDARLTAEVPPDDPAWLRIADVYEFVGFELGYQWGEIRGVREFLEASLRIRREQLVPAHPDIANTSSLLGHVLNQIDEYGQAEELLTESISIYQSAYPEGHPLLSETRSLIGECLSGQGRFESADDILLETHQAILDARGATSRASIDSSYRLVRHYERFGRPDDADRYRRDLTEALAFSRNSPWRWDRRAAAFGTEHAELLEALEGFDRFVLEASNAELSEQEFVARFTEVVDRVLTLRRERLPEDHVLSVIVARIVHDYTDIYLGPGDRVHREMIGEVLAVLDPHRERLPRIVSDAWLQYGQMALLDADLVLAEERFREAHRILAEFVGPIERPTLYAEAWVARVVARQTRFEEAEQQLADTWSLAVRTLGEAHEASSLALGNLMELYEAWLRPELIAPYLEVHLMGREEDTNHGRVNAFAWHAVRLSTFEPPLYELALVAAERSIELEPDQPAYMNTLAMALYRVGDVEEAADIIEYTIELNEGSEPTDFAVLALARKALGDEDAARAALERMDELLASDLHDENHPDNLWLAAEARGALEP